MPPPSTPFTEARTVENPILKWLRTPELGWRAAGPNPDRRPVTSAWVRFMGMDDLVRDGRPQTWLRPGTTATTERRIAAIAGRTMTLDVPLSDSFDSQYLDPPGTMVTKIRPPSQITQAGIEFLHIECPPQSLHLAQLAERLGPQALKNIGNCAKTPHEHHASAHPCRHRAGVGLPSGGRDRRPSPGGDAATGRRPGSHAAECKVSDQAATLMRVCERVILANGGERIEVNGQPGCRVRLQTPWLIEALPPTGH